MKIKYLSDYSSQYKGIKTSNENILVLWNNKWNDFGYETTLNAAAFINGKEIQLPEIKILVKDQNTTYSFLNSISSEQWNGEFPILEHDYISVPTSIDFYELLIGEANLDEAKECAIKLRDASYLVFIEQDESALLLTKNEGFRSSLQRDSSSLVVFSNGYKLFNNTEIKINDFAIEFHIEEKKLNIDFKFDADKRILPSDINVLIGPNGAGKSQTLQNIVYSWLNPNKSNLKFSKNLNISNLIVVSYSPFESFPVDLQKFETQINKSVYNYFGLRKRKKKSGEIVISKEHPKRKSAQSLLNCIKDDAKYGMIRKWSNKISTLERTLEEAFKFDFAAIEIDSEVKKYDLFKSLPDREPIFTYNKKRYLKVNRRIKDSLNFELLDKHIAKDSGVSFFINGNKIKLSSGQLLFTFIVINILGAIKKNSLIIVDEPELFLHPSLEIVFVSMLKKILKLFSSKAILATHSVVTVREIPKICVHVYKDEKDKIFINHPPFETFGGDVQRISSYVFNDKEISKPYESWLKLKLNEYGSAKKLISALGENINEELLIQIHAMERGKW